jgi:hypothetical protein
LVAGGPIRLESDVSDRDQFGRLLRYVYAGEVFVNEALVREGLAIARRYEPDTAQATVLEAAQAAAEADGVGMWAPDACGAAATGTIEIGHIRYDADGNDNFNLNDEWVEFVNPGSIPLDLTGWSIKDESASHRYYFPSGFSLGADPRFASTPAAATTPPPPSTGATRARRCGTTAATPSSSSTPTATSWCRSHTRDDMRVIVMRG